MFSIRNGYDEKALTYLQQHHLPEILEALFTGVTVNEPSNEKEFLIDKINYLHDHPELVKHIEWDAFIDKDKRPQSASRKIDISWVTEGPPCEETILKVFTFFNSMLLKRAFRAFYKNWKRNIQLRKEYEAKLELCDRHHDKAVRRKYFKCLKAGTASQEKLRSTLYDVIKRNAETALLRNVFKEWVKIVLKDMRTKSYFNNLNKEIAEDNDVKVDRISILPKALAILIFYNVQLQDLINCSKVCHKWKELTQATLLWTRIDLANTDKRLISSMAVACLLYKCRPFVCHLNMRSCTFILPPALKLIGDCRNLQDLNLSHCSNITDEMMKEITSGCGCLIYVNLSHTKITNISLRYLARNCNTVQFLDISHCWNLSNKGMTFFSAGKGAEKLYHLNMSACDQVTWDGFRALSRGCSNINTLILNDFPSLTDECIEALTKECRSLQSISILNSPLLTDLSIKHLTHTNKLTVLKLEGNGRFTDATIKNLVRNNPDLHHLYFVDVSRFSDVGIKALGKCTNLRVINIADCMRISDSGLRSMLDGSCAVKLREVNFTNCSRLTDFTLVRIAQRCSSLTYANFSYCESLTDVGVELLSTITSLISLDLSGCAVTDAGVASLGQNARLKDLTFSECCMITDNGIQKLVPAADALENLDISHLNFVTNVALKHLAYCCRRLRTLNVCGCEMLTDEGIGYVSSVCQYLERIDMSGCKQLTDESLRSLRKGCQYMDKINVLYCPGITKLSVMKYRASNRKMNILHSREETFFYLGNRTTAR